LGLVLYYIPELRTPEDSDEEAEEMHRLRAAARMQRRAGGVLADAQNIAEEGEVVILKKEDDFSEHERSEAFEVELEHDLDEMREHTKYGAWGAGNSLKREVDAWDPTTVEDEEHMDVLSARFAAKRKKHGNWWEDDSEPDSWGTAGTPEVDATKDGEPELTAAQQAATRNRRGSALGLGGHMTDGIVRKHTQLEAESEAARRVEEEKESEEFSDAYEPEAGRPDPEKPQEVVVETMSLSKLLEKPHSELTKAELAFLEDEERKKKAEFKESRDKAEKARQVLRTNFEMKKRAQADARFEANYQQIVTIRPDLLEEKEEEDIRKELEDRKWEMRYLPDGSKKMVNVEEKPGMLQECGGAIIRQTAGCAEATENASPCCRNAYNTLNDLSAHGLCSFTPAPPPSTPREQQPLGFPRPKGMEQTIYEPAEEGDEPPERGCVMS